MPDIAEKQWTEADDKNVEQQPNGFPGGMPAYIDSVGRMVMGAIKRSWRRFNPYYATTGTGDQYIVSPDKPPIRLNRYEILNFRIDRDNTTTTPTLQFGRAPAYVIVKVDASGKVALRVGDLVEGKDHAFYFDGTNLVLTNPGLAVAFGDLGTAAFVNVDYFVRPGVPLVTALEAAIAAGYIPTTLPATAGKLWINGGVICVS